MNVHEVLVGEYAAARAFAGVIADSDMDPEDLLHDVVASVLSSQAFSATENPQAYLRTALLNRLKNRRRGLARAARSTGIPPNTAVVDDYPSDMADLLRLPARTRAILWIVDVENGTYKEAASVAGCTEVAARATASRARRRLRTELQSEADGPIEEGLAT